MWKTPLYVDDLVINPDTGQAEPINSRPILPQGEDIHQIKKNMKQLLGLILGYFELEQQKVENGQNSELNELLETYVQENDPQDTEPNPRPLTENLKRRIA